MTGSIASDWRVTSFSALIDGHATPAEFPDHDSTEVAGSGMVGETPPENSFLSFPKGAHPGTFLHAIFEKVDFSNASAAKLSELVAQAMETSPPYEKFSVTVQAMLATVLTAELLDGLRLSALQPGSWVQEMEFYFPLKAIDAKLLSGFFRKHGITAPVDLGRMAERLNFRNVQGMLLGFIDLVFCHAGKYYLLDWKSNHLGTRPEEYRRDNLARDMERKLYPLQYLIYTVALNRYLARRIPGYRYETHFGGVLYLYLRGIDHSCPGNGIYFDKPDAALVRELTDCLIDVEEVYHG
jgi:exodeoxyribonuclease V beta subunit